MVTLTGEHLGALTQTRLIVSADHLVVQVMNAATVCYSKYDRGCKPEGQFSEGDLYEMARPHR
jgi:hypothetical protein